MGVSRLVGACVIFVIVMCGESAVSLAGIQNQPSQNEVGSVARKFRDYNPATYGETKEPLDYFYNELLTLPNAKGYIIYYSGRHGGASQNHRYAKNYLDNRGGIPPERIKALFGGYREDTAIELWIVPEGSAPPKSTPTYFPKKRRRR